MFSSGRSGMLGTSTRVASLKGLCCMAQVFGGDRRPGSKRSSMFRLKELLVQPHANMGSGLVKYTEGNPCIGTSIGEGSSDHSCGRTGLCIGGFCGKTSS